MPSHFPLFSAVFDRSDLLKLLGIIAAAVALYLLAKRFGGGGEAISPTEQFAQAASEAQPPPKKPELIGAIEETEPEPDQPDYVLPAEDLATKRRMNIQIRDWNFAKFDLATGPPDPNSFADELHMDLYDPTTGRRRMQTYFVASPAGLDQMLLDNKWSSMFTPQILILKRYSLDELRAALLEEIGAVEIQRGEVTPEDK
jgi:hypothetical protein